MGLLLRDVVLSRDEIDGLLAGLLTSRQLERLGWASGYRIMAVRWGGGMSPRFDGIIAEGGKRGRDYWLPNSQV